jgi:SWI/SNF-related matrix-associated actin-dependent regulator 1 of chromatin subfamily A
MAKTATLSGTCYALSEYPKGHALYVLRGGKWDKQAKAYTVPATPGNTRALALLGYEVPASVPVAVVAPVAGVEKPSLRLPLAKFMRPYQVEDTLRIEAFHGRVLLANEMGLGKTLISLAWMSAHPEARPTIVVCPACAKLNWADEVGKWQLKERVVILSGTTPLPIWDEKTPPTLLIINYDIVYAWLPVLIGLKPKLIIVDECHRLRNWYAQGKRKTPDALGRKVSFNRGTDSVLRLCRGVPYVLGLSGTPLVGRPLDLFTMLKILRPDIFPSRFEFGMRFCDAKLNPFSGKLEFKGCTHPQELHTLLRDTVMIRHLKSSVLTELPEKQWTTVPLEIDNRSEYDAVEADLAEVSLVRLNYLRQLAALGKLAGAFEWVDTFLEGTEKLIVFVHHRCIGEAFAKRYASRCVTYSGGMPEGSRWESVKRFQDDPKTSLFVGSIDACGMVLNLTAASNVCFVEFPWTKTALDQAADRVHRIGQLATSVNIWLLAAVSSIDSDLLGVIASKARFAGSVLDNDPGQDAVIRLVLRSLRQRVASRIK